MSNQYINIYNKIQQGEIPSDEVIDLDELELSELEFKPDNSNYYKLDGNKFNTTDTVDANTQLWKKYHNTDLNTTIYVNTTTGEYAINRGFSLDGTNPIDPKNSFKKGTFHLNSTNGEYSNLLLTSALLNRQVTKASKEDDLVVYESNADNTEEASESSFEGSVEKDEQPSAKNDEAQESQKQPEQKKEEIPVIDESKYKVPERFYYTFGNHKLDFKYFLHNLKNNVEIFLNSKDWDDDKKQAFRNRFDQQIKAYEEQLSGKTNRFYTDAMGYTVDNNGEFDENSNELDKYLGQYIRSLGNQIVTAQRTEELYYSALDKKAQAKLDATLARDKSRLERKKEEETAAAEIPAFNNYFENSLSSIGGEEHALKQWYGLDEIAGGKLSTQKRVEKLILAMQNYANKYQLSEEQKKQLQEAARAIADGIQEEDLEKLQKIGINQDFVNKWFSEKSLEQQAAEAAQAKKAEKVKADIQSLKNDYDRKITASSNTINNGIDIVPQSVEPKIDKLFSQAYKIARGENATLNSFKNDDAQLIFQEICNKLKEKLLSGDPNFNDQYTVKDVLNFLLKCDISFKQNNDPKIKNLIKEGIFLEDTNDLLYLDDSESFNDGISIIYDKNQKKVYIDFAYNNTTNKVYKKYHNTPSFQVGGNIVKAFQDQKLNFKDRDSEQRFSHANDKIVGGENGTVYSNEDGSFEYEDYARIVSLLGNIGSMALDPLSGAVVGVGSTLTDLTADIADESMTVGDVTKNAFINLGLDAVAIIPGFESLKIARQVGKIAPIILKGFAAYGLYEALSNAGEIKNSLENVVKGDFTRQDLQNVLQGTMALASAFQAGKGVVRNKIQKNKVQKIKGTQQDEIGLRVKNDNGEYKDIKLTGDTATKIREAAKNKEKVNEILSGIPELNGFTVDTKLMPGMSWPVGRDTNGKIVRKKLFTAVPEIFETVQVNDPLSFNLFKKARVNPDTVTKQTTDTEPQRVIESATPEERVVTSPEESVDIHRVVDPVETVRPVEEVLTQEQIELNERIKTLGDDEFNRIVRDAEENSKYKREFLEEAETNLNQEKTSLNDLSNKATNIESEIKSISTHIRNLETKRKTGIDVDGKHISSQKSIQDSKKAIKEDIKECEQAIQQLTQDAIKAGDKFTKNQLLNDIKQWKDYKETLQGYLEKIEQFEQSTSKTKFDELAGKASIEQQRLYEADGQVNSKKQLVEILNGDLDAAKSIDSGKKKVEEAIKNGIKVIDPETGTILGNYKPQEDFQEIVKKYALIDKRGGVLKAKNGVTLREGSNTWYNRVGKNSWKYTIQALKDGQINWWDINKMQKQHSDFRSAVSQGRINLSKTVYTPADNSVGDYQDKYHSYGYNKFIGGDNYDNYQVISSNPNSGDSKYDNTYKGDNLFGSITDDRRILGRDDDYSNDDLKTLSQELYKLNFTDSKGQSYKIGLIKSNDGYYYLGRINSDGRMNDVIDFNDDGSKYSGEDSSEDVVTYKPKTSVTRYGSKDPVPEIKAKLNYWDRVQEKIPLFLDYTRMRWLNNQASRLAQLAADNIKPFLQEPYEAQRRIYGNLQAKAEGEKKKASIINMMSKTMTPDIQKHKAGLLEAYDRGAQYTSQGDAQDNATRKESEEKAWQQNKENTQNRWRITQENAKSMWETAKTKGVILRSAEDEKVHNKDIFYKQGIKYLQDKFNDKKQQGLLQTEKDLARLAVINPEALGLDRLSEDELRVLDAIRSGTSYGSLSTTDQHTYLQVKNKIDWAVSNQMRLLKGIGKSPFEDAIKEGMKSKPVYTMTEPKFKKGGNITVALIEEKIKNADRFQKSILKQIDSFDKKLDRISKSLKHTANIPNLK